MELEQTKQQVVEHLDAFRESGALRELRKAANLIESVEFHEIPAFDDRQMVRTATLDFWLMLLDAIDTARDPTFDPGDVPAARITLSPVTPMKPGYPVTTPDGIADPSDRQKYDASVAANTAKTKHYRFQKELRQLDLELTARADEYIGTASLRSAQSEKEMEASIAKWIRHPERAAHLRSLVAPT